MNDLFIKTILLCSIILLLGGCSSRSLLHDSPTEEPFRPDYSLIFYIHGDSDYLFHSPGGKAVQANEYALKKALDTAQNAKSGEVTIFHRNEKRSLLRLFPRNTSRMYQFQNGKKVKEISYRGDNAASGFMEEEAALFSDHAEGHPGENTPVIFLYFGHEIPQHSETGYHQSYSDREFGTEIFAEEIRSFLPNKEIKFDLVALSTCNNGTPAMASALKPVANTILASPQNLHLSHIDVSELSVFEELSPEEYDPASVATALAQDSFNRLSEDVRTTVTLSVYNLDTPVPGIRDLVDRSELYQRNNRLNYTQDNIDCAEVLDMTEFTTEDGIRTFFRPAQFGSNRTKEKHSGWGCKPVLNE
ncbi:MAG: hypothetical protein R6V27_09505 [Balneolaceae bacterium]